MTAYADLLFFYLLALLLLPAILLGLLGKSLKAYGLFFSAAMLCIVFGENGQMLSLIVFVLWELCLCGIFWMYGRKSRPLLWVSVLLALLPLALVKLGEICTPFAFIRLMGVSYMTFRAVQVLLESYDGAIKELRPLYLAYFLLFFPSVPAGPIDRYRRFLDDLVQRPGRTAYMELLRQGIWKLFGGAFSAIVLGGLVQSCWLAPLPESGFCAALAHMYGYTFFLFFNFAGSSSMAVGIAYILGVRLPENFQHPFLSVDMKDFWARWHISLSTWLRDYVYSRFVMRSLRTKRFQNPRAASYIGYLLTMGAMGAWHGLHPRYLLYGIYHAALMCLNELLDLHWKSFRMMKKQGIRQAGCVCVTFHLFAFGLLIFSGRLI